MNARLSIFAAAALAVAALCGVRNSAGACSRIVYQGEDSLVVVGRSLDWKTPIPTNLYVYPRGMEKVSSNLPRHFSWTSEYGAVYAVGYDGGVTEGMNERGLVINGLFCKGTVYNDSVAGDKTVMSMAVFVPWMLDQCATTDEVCRLLRSSEFEIQGATFDEGTVAALHWGVTDASGHSVIFEFDHGRIDIYDMDHYRAMTNDPKWPEMRAIVDYWQKKGGTHTLPGTVSSPDRCVRANFFVHNVKRVSEGDIGVAITRSILANSSVPYTYTVEGEPNLSSTQWRSYADLRGLRYYFDIVTNMGCYYVDLRALDLRPGRKVLKLDTSATADLVGCANGRLRPAAPFVPMW